MSAGAAWAGGERPALDEQYRQVDEANATPLKYGGTRYIIPAMWWNAWRAAGDEGVGDSLASVPTRMLLRENGPLLQPAVVLNDIEAPLGCIALTEAAWKLISQWYGADMPIQRNVEGTEAAPAIELHPFVTVFEEKDHRGSKTDTRLLARDLPVYMARYIGATRFSHKASACHVFVVDHKGRHEHLDSGLDRFQMSDAGFSEIVSLFVLCKEVQPDRGQPIIIKKSSDLLFQHWSSLMHPSLPRSFKRRVKALMAFRALPQYNHMNWNMLPNELAEYVVALLWEMETHEWIPTQIPGQNFIEETARALDAA